MKYFFVFLIAIVFQFCQTSTFAGSQGYLLTSAAGGGPDSQEMDPNQQKQNTDDAFYDENYELFDDDYAEPGISAPSKTRPVGTRMGGRGGFRNQEDSADGHDFRDGIFEQGNSMSRLIGTYGETRDFLHFLRRIQYDHRQCPENDGQPVDVDVSIVVSNIRAVSEVNMDYALELFYREAWTDNRLQYNKANFKNKTELALHESYTNFLWHPDTFMPNAIASKNPQKNSISHRSLLRLGEGGHVLYSRRISIVAECPMDLTLFPFDKQVCKLGIESYGYTADQVRYKWSKGKINSLTLLKIRLPDFQIKEAYVTSQMETYATGVYSRLYVCFVFHRSTGFCFLQLIIPSTAVVITSWVSLWMESETEFQDMVSIILAITFLIFSYNEMMPRVSYIKAMDIYLGVCFMIVFLSLIKLSIFKYIRQKLKNSKNKMLQGILPILRVETASGALDQINGNVGPETPVTPAPNTNLAPGAGLTTTSSAPTFTLSTDVENNICRRSSICYTTIPMLDPAVEPKIELFSSTAQHKKLSKIIPRLKLTHKNVRHSHWFTQMMFFIFFVTFIFFYFLIYPNLGSIPIDPACLKENAEWFADIP